MSHSASAGFSLKVATIKGELKAIPFLQHPEIGQHALLSSLNVASPDVAEDGVLKHGAKEADLEAESWVGWGPSACFVPVDG